MRAIFSPQLPLDYGVQNNAAGAAYYASVAQWYSELGIDFVKVDCMVSDSNGLYVDDFTLFARAMAAVDILVSVSPGNSMSVENATYLSENALAVMYRISNDLWDNWGDKCPQCFPTGVKSKLDLMPQYADVIGYNGAFPDVDMLPLGTIYHDGGSGPPSHTFLTQNEQLVLLSLAYITRAPLIFGGRLPLDPADTFTLFVPPPHTPFHEQRTSPSTPSRAQTHADQP